jgi:hypothetical protein
MITHSGAPKPTPAGPQHPQEPVAYFTEQPGTHWLNSVLGLEPSVGRKLVRVIAAVLGSAAGILFIAMAFEILPTNYALFGGVACSMLAGLVHSVGATLFPADRDTLIAGNTKLQAALAMSVGPQRDQALMKLARESAEEGESNVAAVALQSIHDQTIRDEAAAACAVEIAGNEGADKALPVARMIQDNARRNEVLQKLMDA